MHEVETALIVGEKAWHGIGTLIPYAPTIEDAIRLAGLDWTVSKQAIQRVDGTAIDSHVATVRSSDGRQLGIVGKAYEPLQNIDRFKWFQPFIDSGVATIETAISLREGSRVLVCCKLNSGPIEVVSGDTIQKYLMLAGSHDSSLAEHVSLSAIRTVCANTLKVALAQGDKVRVKHTKHLKENLALVRDTVNAIDGVFQASAEQFKALARKGINQADLNTYVKRVFNIPIETKRQSPLLEKIVPLFEVGKGNNLPGVAGTYWAAYNAVTEYLTHYRGKDANTRLDSNLFGVGDNLNTRALNIALEMSQAA